MSDCSRLMMATLAPDSDTPAPSVQDRGPFAQGRVLDFSLGAARKIGCDGICRVTVRRAGYE